MRRNKQSIPVPSSALGQKNSKVFCNLVSATEPLDRIKSDKIGENKNSRDYVSVTETYPWILVLFNFIRQKDRYWKKTISI